MDVIRRLLPLAVGAVAAVAPLPGFAGCDHPIVVPIHFAQGAACWQHVGPGTTFTGQFGARQRVTVAAIGQFNSFDAGRIVVTTGHWQLYVSGPGGFSANGDGGEIDTVLPHAGQYTFEIGPCAVWGAPGMIEICAQ